MYIDSFIDDLFAGVSFFNDSLNYSNSPRTSITTPDNDEAYRIISIEVPGLKREEISIDASSDKLLTVELKAKYNKKLQFVIPPEVDLLNIKSKLEYGVLEIKLHRSKESRRSIHVDIA